MKIDTHTDSYRERRKHTHRNIHVNTLMYIIIQSHTETRSHTLHIYSHRGIRKKNLKYMYSCKEIYILLLPSHFLEQLQIIIV